MNARDVLALIKTAAMRHYVYVLRKPSGAPFYVGVGTGRRLLDHAIFARRQHLDSHKLRVIRKLWRLGKDIEYAIHEFYSDRASAELAEAALILAIGRRDLRTGPLTNVTAGGEGAPSPSDAVLSARSIKLKEAWARRDKVSAMAHLRSPEVALQAAKSRMGQKRGAYAPRNNDWVTTEMRAKRSALLKADPVSRRPGVAAKISASLRGKSRPDHWTKTRPAKRGAHPRARAVSVKGQRFACLQDAAEGCGVSRSTMELWIKRSRHGAQFSN